MPIGLFPALIGWDLLQEQIQHALNLPLGILLLLILLSIVNNGIEVYKHHLALAFNATVNTKSFYYGFVRGMLYRFILPNKMGLSASVALAQPRKYLLRNSLSLAANNFTQLICTLIGGAVALVLLGDKLLNSIDFHFAWIGSISLLILTSCIMVYIGSKRAKKLVRVQSKLIKKLSLYSLLRYFIFLLQYSLVAKFFIPEITMISHMGLIAVVFLLSTLIPIGLAGGLGTRESLAFVIYGLVAYEHPELAVAATMSIWFFNLLLPAIISALTLPLLIFIKKGKWA